MYNTSEDPAALFFTVFFSIIFSCFVAMYAGRKGKSSILWFFISFIISPIIAFAILYFTSPESEKYSEKQSFSESKDGVHSVTDQIRSLWDLKQDGAITEEEFLIKKKELLSR